MELQCDPVHDKTKDVCHMSPNPVTVPSQVYSKNPVAEQGIKIIDI